jgi:hypothetical protein
VHSTSRRTAQYFGRPTCGHDALDGTKVILDHEQGQGEYKSHESHTVDAFILTGIFSLPILNKVMKSTRTFFYFAFTYRFFFNEESGPAKFENDVLET